MDRLDIFNRRYLGINKLSSFIKDIVDKNCVECNSFFDVFAGTGVVAYSFNNFFKQIIVNDILESNFYAYNVWFSSDYYDEVKIDKLINEYNKNRVFNENYFSVMFADTYFSVKDCMLIGYIREDIENKYNSGLINLREKYILITALIYSMDRIANTVGHYDAYRKSKIYLIVLSCSN